jgi:CheY-like chemotaxis protein
MADEQKTKVLMLDDEKLVLMLYKNAFDQRGYDVSTFTTADEALGALRGGLDPALILLDITMPESMNGYEFLDTLAREGLAKNAVKAALTNESQDAELARTTHMASVRHFQKIRYTPAQLVEAVGELIHKK